MTKHEIMTELEMIIEDATTGVLATVDEKGCPHMRWMTPTILKDRPNAVFAITSSGFAKAMQLKQNSHVQWMIQTKMLDKILNICGVVNILDNSSIRNEVLEFIGPRLTTFWKIKTNEEANLLVLETVVQEATLFIPMKGVKTTVKF